MGTVTWFKSVRIEVRTKEKNHTNRPHCHCVQGKGPNRPDVSIDLVTLEVLACREFSEKAVAQLIEQVKLYQAELMAKWMEYHG